MKKAIGMKGAPIRAAWSLSSGVGDRSLQIFLNLPSMAGVTTRAKAAPIRMGMNMSPIWPSL